MIDRALLAARVRSGAIQMVSIIASVTVALQFQDCHERNTNARIGRNAQKQIEEEIGANREKVAESLSQLTAIVETMHAREADAKTIELHENHTLSLPALFSGAYDAAIASGAMRHMPADRAALIARVYKLQNWIALIQERVIMLDLDPLLAMAADTQDNRYNGFMLQMRAYEMLQHHFEGLVQFYDASLAWKPAAKPH